MKLLINTHETAESLEVAGDQKEAEGQWAVVDPGKEFQPDPRAAAREEEEEGAGQPGANKTSSLDDVSVANAIEATKEVEIIMALEAAPSASIGATPEKGRPKKSPGAEDAVGRTWVQPRKEGAGSLVDAARQRQRKRLLFSA